MKTAFLFSGQGSQYPAMGKELLEKNPENSIIYDKASDILGYDLKKITYDSTESELSRTIYAQPSIMAMSLLAFEIAKKNGITYDAVAGHSLGEYAAMVAAGVLSIEDGFKVIKARAEAMDKAAQSSNGTMAAVLKLKPQKVEEICDKIDGYVVPVNYNSPIQTVIAGEKIAVENASKALSEEGARVMPLKVASAFHSKLMQKAADEFYESIKDIKFNTPEVNVYSNVYGKMLTDFSDMPLLLAKHIVSPVRFTDELNEMAKEGFDTFIELGPGKVLAGLVKKTLKNVRVSNIEDMKSLVATMGIINQEG